MNAPAGRLRTAARINVARSRGFGDTASAYQQPNDLLLTQDRRYRNARNVESFCMGKGAQRHLRHRPLG